MFPVCPGRLQNIDTDQIIPAEYLTLVPSKVGCWPIYAASPWPESRPVVQVNHLTHYQCQRGGRQGPAGQPSVRRAWTLRHSRALFTAQAVICAFVLECCSLTSTRSSVATPSSVCQMTHTHRGTDCSKSQQTHICSLHTESFWQMVTSAAHFAQDASAHH